MNPDEIKKNELILSSFLKLIEENNLNKDELADEIISSYVVNTINQFYEEYECHKIWLDHVEAESILDVENFVEIIDAYFSGFSQINKKDIVAWLINMKKEIEASCKQTSLNENRERNLYTEKDDERLEDNLKKENSHAKSSTNKKSTIKNKDEPNDPNINLLIEMFPSIDLTDIKKAYKRCQQNYEKSIDELLCLQNGSIIKKDEIIEEIVSKNQLDLTEEERQALKEKTVQKFGYIAVDEDGNPVTSTSAPKVNWNNEKKLVRYYDSKVVSTKGEKFFEYKTEEDLEAEKQLKKTFINLKPARKYRFH